MNKSKPIRAWTFKTKGGKIHRDIYFSKQLILDDAKNCLRERGFLPRVIKIEIREVRK